MNEEIMRVLKMVEEGKIDSEKAGEIIKALGGENINLPEKQAIENQLVEEPKAKEFMERMLIIKVDGPKDKVNVRLPIKFIKGVLGACRKLPVNVEGMENIDIDMILSAIDEGLVGKIVDVQSSSGEIVEISIM